MTNSAGYTFAAAGARRGDAPIEIGEPAAPEVLVAIERRGVRVAHVPALEPERQARPGARRLLDDAESDRHRGACHDGEEPGVGREAFSQTHRAMKQRIDRPE